MCTSMQVVAEVAAFQAASRAEEMREGAELVAKTVEHAVEQVEQVEAMGVGVRAPWVVRVVEAMAMAVRGSAEAEVEEMAKEAEAEGELLVVGMEG